MKTTILITLLVFSFASQAGAEDAAREHAARAAAFRAEGRLEEALVEYKEAVRLSGLDSGPPSPRRTTPLEAASRLRREHIRVCLEKADAPTPA